jgi:ATP-grasp domain
VTNVSRPVVVVDPMSAGVGLAPAFASRGVPAVAVLTGFAPPAGQGHPVRAADFVDVLRAGDDLTGLARRLAELDPLCVVPGAEPGVEVAETLSELVMPGRGNVPALAAARRDKWQMAAALRAAGVPHLRQVCTADPAEVERWRRREELTGAPIVLKPPKSCGTDDVYVVEPGDDWRPRFDQILGSTNKLSLRNDAVLVMELARGTEYEVDTYSIDGRHGLTAVCRYTKEQRADRLGIYTANEFVPPEHPHVPLLLAYVRQVLDAVGVRNGPAHVEVMLTGAGPRLIEVGARLAGADQQEFARLATGDSQIDRCVRHWVDGERDTPGYRWRQHVKSVYLTSPRSGVLGNAERLAEVVGLPTFHLADLPYAAGDTVPRTEDLWTSLGCVVLATTQADALAADERMVRKI